MTNMCYTYERKDIPRVRGNFQYSSETSFAQLRRGDRPRSPVGSQPSYPEVKSLQQLYRLRDTWVSSFRVH